MELRQLRYFRQVAEVGSVSRAAVALSVAQPAVSRQISSLEDTLGTPLFFRTGRGVKLTEAGQHLYDQSAAILEAVRQAEQTVHEVSGMARGTVVVGSMPTVVRHVAPALIPRIASRYPEIALEFTEGLSGYVNEWLSNGLLDVAIVDDVTPAQHFIGEPLVSEQLVFIGGSSGQGKPVSFADVAEQNLILPRRKHCLRLIVERAAIREGHALRVSTELDSLSGILALVRQGNCASVIPRGALTLDDLAMARPIIGPNLTRTLALSTSTQRPVSRATRAVTEELKAVMRDLVDNKLWPGAVRYNMHGKSDGQTMWTPDPQHEAHPPAHLALPWLCTDERSGMPRTR